MASGLGSAGGHGFLPEFVSCANVMQGQDVMEGQDGLRSERSRRRDSSGQSTRAPQKMSDALPYTYCWKSP
jgi:hypothetical protein